MAIAFAHVSIHSRSKGHSAVAASAYRTASRLMDERTGVLYDFTHRDDVVFTDTLLPHNLNPEFYNREYLWNQVEHSEKRIDSQVCKDVVLALPKELDLTQQIELTKRFANTHFVDHGLAVDIAIHDHGDGNPHAHILVTTRRLEAHGFSKYKARDLNPAFYSGNVVEQDYWGEQWRTSQELFFKENNIDLTVDLNHLISERHEGRMRGDATHYLKEENDIIRQERVHLALESVGNLINHISQTHSVFTRRDIEKLVFKTLNQSSLEHTQYTGLVEQVLNAADVVHLGVNDEGKDAYTTRNQYVAESILLNSVEHLLSRTGHVYAQTTNDLAKSYQLNEEQSAALEYVAQGADLSVLIGRPGVGKSYLLKPVKEHYEANGCRVIGASLSGKVAKALQADTGIQSYTLASLNYRLQHDMIRLSSKDVVVIDEAGMVDFASLSSVIDSVNKAHAKLVLVGDPDQLKPIHKGEIFKGIASIAGFMELSQIRRQHDPMDREASLKLSKGQIEEVLSYYNSKGAIRFSDHLHDSVASIVYDWQGDVNTSSDIKEQVMFAFSRAAVASINMQARDALKQKAIVHGDEFLFDRSIPEPYSGFIRHEKVMVRADIAELEIKRGEIGRIIDFNENHLYIELHGQEIVVPKHQWSEIIKVENNTITLSQGERILFRKNDAHIGVRNGDMAFIESINAYEFTATLDSGEKVTIPKTYKHLDYGYATTVHKGQGMTVDGARVLIDSHYWDRFLSFVAMTRHRKSLTIYADKHQHPDLNALSKTLSRSSTRDNVIDWPLDLAIRHGFDSDSLIGKVINHLAGVGHKIKEKYNYLVNYEAYARQKMIGQHRDSKLRIRGVAKKIADYLDEQSQYSILRKHMMKKADALKVEPSSLDDFKGLYEQSIRRDTKAHQLWTLHGEQLSDVQLIKFDKEALKKAFERHERYLVIKEIIENKDSNALPEELVKRAGLINMDKDKIHVLQLAQQHQKPTKECMDKIEHAQKANRQLIYKSLAMEYPVLAEYDKLHNERSKITGFKAEQLDKLLLVKAREISKNEPLFIQLKRDLPKFAQALSLRIKNHELGLDKER